MSEDSKNISKLIKQLIELKIRNNDIKTQTIRRSLRILSTQSPITGNSI